MSDATRCPTPEQLAAFVAGQLTGAELMTVAEHLRGCEDCRLIVADAAWVDRQTEAKELAARTSPPRARRTWPWWLAAAAAAIAVTYLGFGMLQSDVQGNAISRLASAAPRSGRHVEPRVTGGFPWAPLQSVARGGNPGLDAAQMKFIGAAGEVLEQTVNDPSPDAQHAAAIAHLIAGRPSEAAVLLTRVISEAPTAGRWNDLAAARYAAAVQLGQPTQLAGALAAADAALALQPQSPEALFNRALILERLGLRDQARDAWERYLVADPGSSWTTEARAHVRELAPVSDFRRELERDYDHLVRDPAAARTLAWRFPQHARLWGETRILGNWADAVRKDDEAEAERHLFLARTFGEAIAERDGDRMLLDAARAIAAADDSQRRALAEAHGDFRDAQTVFRAGRPADAGVLFEKAVASFERGGSPLALPARYFLANTRYDRGELAVARRSLEQLAATAPPAYAAHRAQVLWQIGLVRAAGGEWGKAIDALEEGIATFDRIRETNYAATLREILAQIHDRLGDPRAAWAHRLPAMQELGRVEDVRLQVAVQAAARAAALGHDWQISLSFLDLVLHMATHGGDDLLTAETLLLRARVGARLGRTSSAASDLLLARQAEERLKDSALRELARADRLAAEGSLAAAPHDAVALLSRAIEFHRDKGRRMFLPALHLDRGRAHVKLGDRAAAASDFEAGINELESQRLSVAAADQRWGMFSSASELFDEAMALALADGRDDMAFRYCERARARELLDSMGQEWTAPATLPPSSDAILIEYASLPTSLVIFIVDHNGIRTLQRPVTRATLAGETDQLVSTAAANDRNAFQRSAALLHTRLVEPINDMLEGVRTVVFVPDTTLMAVPFAALRDQKGGHVIERHAVVIAPSAGVFARLSVRPQLEHRDLRLLLVAGASGRLGDPRQLTALQREADAVAAAYRTQVRKADSAIETFREDIAAADVVHFVGHADEPDAAAGGALLIADNQRLDARDIASLRLPHTRAVVLAACATARGHARPGDANVSLARAFLAAGAPSVVATLWPIDDRAAAEFFPRLHHYLAGGLAPADALRATQLEWIHRRNAPPGLWAAVQTIGN
jgi:CHAT domain-containing protein